MLFVGPGGLLYRPDRACLSGRVTVKAVPSPWALRRLIFPRCRSAMAAGKTVIITGAGRAVLSDGVSCGSIGYGIATSPAENTVCS